MIISCQYRSALVVVENILPSPYLSKGSRVAQLLVTWRSQKGQLSSHLSSGVRRRTEALSL